MSTKTVQPKQGSPLPKTEPTDKKPYASPQLTRYGSVLEITAGASGTVNDGGFLQLSGGT